MALEILNAHRQLRAALSKAVCNDLLIELGKAARIDDMLAAFSYMRTAQVSVSVCVLQALAGHVHSFASSHVSLRVPRVFARASSLHLLKLY
jgi:hypothetical protein